MARLPHMEELNGPFTGQLLDYLYALGGDNDQGAILTGATITVTHTPVSLSDTDQFGRVYVSNAGNITGVIVQSGIYLGQLLAIYNYGSGTVTMAAVGTSHVLGGTGIVIAVNQGLTLQWIKTANINSGAGCWINA